MFAPNHKRIRMILLTVLMIVSLAFGNFTATRAQSGDSNELFFDAGDARPSTDTPAEIQVARMRYVNVNIGMLFDANGKPRTRQSLPEVSLSLFPETQYTGVVTRVQKDKFSTAWIGKLKGKAHGYFYLVVADGAFIAHIASADGVYEVSFAGDNLYKVVQIDQSVLEDHDPAAQFDPPADLMSEAELGPNADSGSTIDIMVAYTDDARAAEGSTAAMKARIALAVTETNVSYANSGVIPRLRLVHVQEYSYTETGNLGTDLNRFKGNGDGYFDSIHSLRNTYGADMVGLIVENGGPYCGLAAAIMASATNAFQVTDRGCATGYYSFGHEFGHLMGARHDTYVDTGTTPYAYGHGYVHTGSTTAQRWRTVMAYNDRCSSLGYNCTRLQWWSNPTKTYNGGAMGVTSSSENYKVLNNTRVTVANFRTQVIGFDFYSSFTSSSAGWAAAKGTWVLSGGYYRSVGLANTGASAKTTSKFGDMTYTVRMYRSGACTSCSNRVIIRGNAAAFVSTNWWKPSYYFQYTNDGSFSVYEVTSAGSIVALKSWTASAAIAKNGWNTLKVVAVGSTLKFYINNTLVWSGADSSLLVGQAGAGFYRDANAGTLYLDYASSYNTPTADLPPAGDVMDAGIELEGGSIDQSPVVP